MGTSTRLELLNMFSSESGGFARKFMHAAINRLRVGRLEVEMPDGETIAGGSGDDLRAKLIVRDKQAFRRIVQGGAIGFAESYIEGEWETPNLAVLLELFARNRDAFSGLDSGRWPGRLMNWLLHLSRRNSRTGSRRNIASHYDLGNDFYQLWLDRTMTYSSGLFDDSTETLEQAQENKYRAMLDRLELDETHTLLEIGSGWGGFALYAARETGCRVHSITLSDQQLAEARKRARLAGLSERVRFEFCDYRDVEGQFDRIVSIEMFEAVGERYWPQFFKTIRERLAPGGKAALQVITIADEHFDTYRRNPDFIQLYIFPGGMLPSPAAFCAEAGKAGLSCSDQGFHADSYAQTLQRWDLRVFAARKQLLGLGYDTRFLRMWHYYLAYCIAGFRVNQIDLMQIDLQHAEADS